MTRPIGQLDRSLAALTIGMQKGMKARERSVAESTGEYEQQVRVPIAGQAGKAFVTAQKRVTWQLPFLSARSQRLAPFDTPHFSSGIVMGQPAPTKLVVVHATVLSWTVGQQNWIVGATVEFASQAPGADDAELITWTATAHLRFQGYASFPEGEEFQ